MPITARERFAAALRTVLVDRAGAAADGQGVAEATLGLWQQIAARLVPLIGVLGVEALLSRALHLTARRFAWLRLAGAAGSGVLPALKVRLAEQSPAVAADAGHALLLCFTELLADLIGDSLTERLLAPIWAPAEAEQENA